MILVLDCETTGLSPAVGHTVVELAAVALTLDEPPEQYAAAGCEPEWGIGHDYFSTLVAPGRRLTPEAQAVHHLRDADLRAAPHLPQAIQLMATHFSGDIGMLAAHNAAFDQSFLNAYLPGCVWLCTYRLACHLYPAAPSHSNQVLRYHLNLDAEVRAALPSQTLAPHRALYDAITTAVILKHMLAARTLQDLIVLQDQSVLQRKVRFGKYRGQEWAAVPRDYLAYVLRQNGPGGFDTDTLHTANYYLNGGT